MRVITSLFLLIAIGIAAQSVFALPRISDDEINQEEYQVYRFLLTKMFVRQYPKRVLIQGYTKTDDLRSYSLRDHLRNKYRFRDTQEDFLAKNNKACKLTNNFNLGVETILLYEEENEKLSEKLKTNYDEYEKLFNEVYPDAGTTIVTFSRVGFNKKQTKALVHVGDSCGWTCGEGNYITLEKKSGQWKIKKKYGTWIS